MFAGFVVRFSACLVLLATVLAGVACSNSAEKSGGDRTLIIYNGQEEEITAALADAFEKKTGIPTEIRNGEGFELANQILAEGSRSPADVVFTENSPEITLLAKQHRLAAVKPEVLARVADRYSSPEDAWVGFAARESVLVYNPDLVAEQDLPRSVLDLADPRWQGKVGIAPGGSDFHPIVTAVRVTRGEDVAKTWLDGLRRNALALRNNNAILRAVNSGQLALGMINQHYWHRLRAAEGDAAVKARLFHFGNHDPGTLVNVSGAGVVAASDNQDAAQQFLAFIVSDEGQRLIVSTKDYEYPLATGVAADPGLPPLDSLGVAEVGLAQLDDGTATIELMTDAGLL
jgi:iron(III) transport system substrate-binding protein